MRYTHLWLLVLLIGCSNGGDSAPPPTTSITLANNSDIDVTELYVLLSPNEYMIDFQPPVLPGYSTMVDVEPAFCGHPVSIKLGLNPLRFPNTVGVVIPCGTTDRVCEVTGLYNTTYKIMMYTTTCKIP